MTHAESRPGRQIQGGKGVRDRFTAAGAGPDRGAVVSQTGR